MKRIIILEKKLSSATQNSFNYLFWADVPLTHQIKYIQPATFVSAYVDATTTELNALRTGTIAERVDILSFSPGESVPSIKATLVKRFNQFQSEVNGDETWKFYGTFFDGTSWTMGGI